MRSLTPICVVSILAISLPSIAQQWKDLNLKDHGIELGVSVIFENEISEVDCRPLIATDGTVLSWIFDVHQTDSMTLVHRCVQYESELQVSDQSRLYGGARDEWEQIRFSNETHAPEYTPIEIPGYEFFSNPRFCDSKVAYWIEDDWKVSIRVFDLSGNEILVTEFVKNEELETDNPSHFDRPDWSDDCSSVTVENLPPIRVH